MSFSSMDVLIFQSQVSLLICGYFVSINVGCCQTVNFETFLKCISQVSMNFVYLKHTTDATTLCAVFRPCSCTSCTTFIVCCRVCQHTAVWYCTLTIKEPYNMFEHIHSKKTIFMYHAVITWCMNMVCVLVKQYSCQYNDKVCSFPCAAMKHKNTVMTFRGWQIFLSILDFIWINQ